MFWIELIIVLAIIFLGVRIGGTFLAMAGGIGMFIMTFILHVTPSDPPITVILIMIAVICAAATMQACGGLDYLVKIAEKILRRNPRMIPYWLRLWLIFSPSCAEQATLYTAFFLLSMRLPLRQASGLNGPSQPRLFHPSRPLQRARFQRLPWQSLLLWLRPQAMAPSISLPCCLSASLLLWLVPWSARLQLSRRAKNWQMTRNLKPVLQQDR